jgi:hypothetical protein
MRLVALVLAAACLCLAGCGVPGAPQPPSLGIPNTVNDLQAFRKGSTVTFTWNEPTQDTDGELIRKPGTMILSRSTSEKGPFQTVTQVPLPAALDEKQHEKASASDDIASLIAGPDAPDFFYYRVVSISNRHRSSSPSNLVSVPAVLTAAPPQNVAVRVVPQGISISFDLPVPPQTNRLNSQFIYRVMRRQTDSNAAAAEPVLIGQFKPGVQTMPMLDSRIEWEKHYLYWITPVTLWQSGSQEGEVEGDDSASAAVFAHDVFPPATPSGVQAVFSGVVEHPGIDLTWAPNIDEDLAGYNVFRHMAAEPAVKINSSLIKTPAFHDSNVSPGQTYLYSVTAVDLRGNESARSAEASESVPRQ